MSGIVSGPVSGPVSRIRGCFDKAEASQRKLLIPYITAGDPGLDTTLVLMHEMVKNGADIIELGVPFSDPMADGPVIQAACERALKQGTTLSHILDLVKKFRTTDQQTPVVLMGYMNPIETMGHETFAAAAASAGVDGTLIVDLPPEEGDELVPILKAHGLDTIFLLSPNTPDYRARQICASVSGYIYYVSLKGITGASTLDAVDVGQKVANIKSLSSLPVAVGFGIRDAESASQVAAVSDAVVVGSVFVGMIGEYGNNQEKMVSEINTLLSSMRTAIDAS